MNKLTLVSDIHGNYPALSQVVDAEGSDSQYIVLGDIHGLNAFPQETLSLVHEIGDFVLAGNHDKAMFEYGEGHVNSDKLSTFECYHTLANLSVEQVKWMLELSHMEIDTFGHSRVCMTHAYPWPEKASGYETGNAGVKKRGVPQVGSTVSDDYDYVFHGHTHEQYSLDVSRFGGNHDVIFVNPGSLGWDGTYAVVDVDTGAVELKQVEYDEGWVEEHVQNVLPDDCPNVSQWL